MRFVNFPKEFWVLTYPIKNDKKISDIMFKSDIETFTKMISTSELTFEEIYGIYGAGKSESAKSDANALIVQLEKGEISPYGGNDE